MTRTSGTSDGLAQREMCMTSLCQKRQFRFVFWIKWSARSPTTSRGVASSE